MPYSRLTMYLLRQTMLGFLLAGVISPALFTNLLLPVPYVQAAANMCSAADLQGYLDDPNYEPRRVFLPGKDGGIKLDQAAEFLADLTDLTGAYYDEGRDQIVFIGTKETTIPNFDKDDLAVAIRSIFFADANPGLKIEYSSPEDFGNNKLSTEEMNVNYMPSKAGDQGNPNEQWKDDQEQFRDKTPYGIEDTAFAKILFEADWKLKQYWLGYGRAPDGGTPEKIRSNVPDYASFYDRYAAKGVDENSQKSVIRVWLRPQKITLQLDAAASAFVFDEVKMELQTEHYMSENKDGNWDAAAQEFAAHHTQHYDEFAQETPAYDQVKRLAKIVSVVKWLKDNRITTDFNWARHYEPAYVATPRKVKMMVVDGTPPFLVAGSLNFLSPNVYTAGNGTGNNLKTSALASQPTPADFHWNFTNSSQTYEAVAVSAEVFRNTGAYTSGVSDLSLPTVGDAPLAFTRTYSSQTAERTYAYFTSLGKGWESLPARLTSIDLTGGAPACGMANQAARLSFATQGGAYETFTYDCTNGGYQSDHPLYTSQLGLAADGLYTITTKNHTIYSFDHFTGYGDFYRVRSIADHNGNTIHYDYHEPSANLAKISDDHGHFIMLEYGAFQRVQQATDSSGRTVRYTYDESGRLTTVTDVLGRLTHYQYDDKNRLTGIVDPAGQNVMQAQYNELNKVTSQTDALGRTASLTYDETNRSLTATDSTGLTEKHRYDADARLLEAIDAAGQATTYTYGTWRAPETVTDKRGNISQYQYDVRGNVTKATAPDGLSVDTAYNSADLPTQITDGRYTPGRTTSLTYDAKHNLIKQDVAGITQQMTLDQSGQVIQAMGPLGQTAAYQYNEFGQPVAATDPLGNVTRYEYDSLGRVIKQTDPAGISTTYTYDKAGRLLTSTDAAGQASYTYDNLDHLTKVTLPDGTTAQYSYTAANQISKVTDAKGNATTYTYDAKDNLISRQTAAGTEYKTEYDALSRPTKAITPLNKVNQLAYDAIGNPIASTDAAGKVITQEFDALNRPTKSLFADQTAITRAYDGRGNILSASDPSGQLVLTHDLFDRLTQSKDPFGNTVNYTYDASGRRTSLTYPSGQQVNYGYNANSQLTTVTDWNNQATNITYYQNGFANEKKLPNGLTAKYEYDTANRLKSVRYINLAGQIQAQTDMERSAVGNITRLTETGPLFTQAIGGANPSPTPAPAPPLPTPPAEANIQAHWKMEEANGTRNDVSVNANHLTDNNSVLSSSDHAEGVSSADAERDNNQYLSISDSAQKGLDSSGGLTLALWFKRESTDGSQVLMQKYVETGFQTSYSFSVTPGNVVNFTVTDSGGHDLAVNSVTAFTTPGVWHHVAAVFEPLTALKIYVNGVLDASSTFNIPGSLFNSTAPFHLGAASENPSVTNAFDGLLDDAYVYNKALTEAEIATLMQSAGSGGGGGSPGTGGITTFTYNQIGQLLAASYPDATTFDYAYDAIGNRLGGTYDSDAKLLQAGSTAFAYDDNGALQQKQDGSTQKFYTSNARHELARVGGEVAPPETWELTYAKQTDSAWNIDIGSYSAPAIADLDADSKLDLLIGESGGTLKHYEQSEAKANVAFNLVAAKFGNIDIGSYSAPDLADIDADGDKDLFIGKSDGKIAFYKNTGTPQQPTYILQTSRRTPTYFNIDIGSDSVPRLADIDADGDLDFFIGKSDGTLSFYKNTGTKQQAAFTLDSAKYNTIDIGSDSAPRFADIDADSDLDLFVGKSDGTIAHYQNTGTREQANFKLQTAKYQSIDVGSASQLFFQDLTGDSLADLLIGESGGKLRLYVASKKVISGPDPGTTFTYDALGSRIAKKTNGVETRYVNDISGELPYVLAELNSSNQVQSLNLYAAGLTSFGKTAATERFYPITDPLGNVRFITDSAGNLIARYSYDPFGNVTKKEGTVNSVFTFSGEQFDQETALTFLRARYYDPSTGMFLSRDPVLGPLTTPLEHGEYTYARNNPVNLSDPSGKLVELVARMLDWGFKNPGTHYYLDINRGVENHFTLSANPQKLSKYIPIPMLTKTPPNYEFSKSSLDRSDSRYAIASPFGEDTDSMFIEALMAVYNNYKNNALYTLVPRTSKQYNSNSFAWSLLTGAGVDPECLESLPDPSGYEWAPGWGNYVPGMTY